MRRAPTSGDTAITSSTPSTRTNRTNRFIKEQIAGDELYPDDPAALVATGFNRHFPDESNARKLLERRQEIPERYYRYRERHVSRPHLWLRALPRPQVRSHPAEGLLPLQAFFANTRIEDHLVLDTAERRREWERAYAAWDAKT